MNPATRSEGPPTCIRHGRDRAIARRHRPDCRAADCAGCSLCPARHCSVCGTQHLDTEPQTCIGCLGRARNDLITITDRLALGEQLLQDWWAPVSPGTPTDGGRTTEAPLPGGDILVMVGPGSWALSNRDRDKDQRDDDPDAIAFELSKWEDDWRATRGQPAARYERDLSKTREYLDRNMGWAAQNLPAFPEFTKLLRQYRTRLAAAVRDSDQPARGVHCLDCPDATLARPLHEARPCRHRLPAFKPLGKMFELPDGTYRYTTTADRKTHYEIHQAAVTAYFVDHQACEQGGFADVWTCPRCHRNYTRAEYGLAVRTQYDQRRTEMDARKTRLDAATAAYVATSSALLVPGPLRFPGQTPPASQEPVSIQLPDHFHELVDAHAAARVELAAALKVNGYAVPVGLLPLDPVDGRVDPEEDS